METIDETGFGKAAAPEPVWRLALRLAIDLLGFAALAAIFLGIAALLAAGADIVLRGLAPFWSDLAAARDFRETLSPNTLLLASFALGALVYVCLALAVFAMARLRRGARWRDYIAWAPFRPDLAWLWIAGIGVIWGVGIGSVIESVHPAAKNWVVLPSGIDGVLVSFALVVLLGPLCEELLFRGWLYTALRPRFGFIATLAATASLFALGHWESSHLYAAAVFPIGLLLGYVRERSGSMRASFAFHGIYNLAGWILASFQSK